LGKLCRTRIVPRTILQCQRRGLWIDRRNNAVDLGIGGVLQSHRNRESNKRGRHMAGARRDRGGTSELSRPSPSRVGWRRATIVMDLYTFQKVPVAAKAR
jgi:hypothetical protein